MIAAAGSGQRLGAGGPKAFVDLGGRPMIEWSLRALEEARSIGSILVAIPPGSEADAERSAALAAPGTPTVVVPGGASRPESVALALERVETDLLAIHDAARPLIGAGLIDRVLARLEAEQSADGVIAAAPLKDTVKRASAPRAAETMPAETGTVAETLNRELLWGAQTPQAFRAKALREAQASAREAGKLDSATDEAWLIERVGGRVLLEPAPASNLKVTTSVDLRVAESLLAADAARGFERE